MIEVAIIGGGFSGTLVAVNMVRHDGPAGLLFERNHQPGLGLAYSTPSAAHLLNVRASNMSALPDDPGHFERWAEAACGASRSCFVPRATYGQYLNSLFAAARDSAPGRLAVATSEVTGLERAGGHFRLMAAGGEVMEARRVVLATGNLPASAPAGFDPVSLGGLYANDPWQPDLLPAGREDQTVVLVGSGLTAVDAALLLRERGHRGAIVALSRRGLLPRVHGEPVPPPPLKQAPPPAVLAILRHLRQQARALGWRAAVDQLRPHTQKLWRQMPMAERQRFLRHGRTWWDVHRHRMAPEVAAEIEQLRRDGLMRVEAGRRLVAERDGDEARVRFSRRDGSEAEIRAGLIVNCTGPGRLEDSAHPLILSVLRGGLARPDPLGMGLDTDHLCRVIGPEGEPDPNLFAVGPLTRGSFWEITAVPDICRQVWTLARMLSNAHWVGGEGL